MSSVYDFSLSLYENGQWNDCRDLLEEHLNFPQEHEDQESMILLLALLYMQRKQKEELHKLLIHHEVLNTRKDLLSLIMGDPARNSWSLSASKDFLYCYTLGVYWSLRLKPLEAKKAYEKALEINPSFIPIYNNLALIYEETGQIIEAKETYEKGLALNKDDPYLQINLAIFLSRIGSFRKNWTISESLTQLPPPLLAMLVSYLFVCEERYDLAIKVLDKQLSKTEKITSLWYARGLILETQGYFEQAFTSYQKAWRLDFSNKTVVRALLQLLLKNKRIAEMQEIVSLLSEEDPHREDVRFFQALLQMQRKDWQAAELNLRYILNHAQVKNLHSLAKNIPHIQALDPIINADLSESFYEHSLYLLAVLYDHTHKYEQSLLVLERLEKEIPHNELYSFAHILLLSKVGKTQEALKKLENTLKQHPEHIMCQLLKSKILFDEGLCSQALQLLQTLDSQNQQVSEFKKEIEEGLAMQAKHHHSQLWQLPWPKLENSLRKYFIDSKQRAYRYLWQIKDKNFFLPALPAETIGNHEMLAFYQEVPLNASSPFEDLYEALETGESVQTEELELEKLKAFSSSASYKKSQEEESIKCIGEDLEEEKLASVEDLAIFLDALEGSTLLNEPLSRRLSLMQQALMGNSQLLKLDDWLNFWQESFNEITKER